MRIRTIAYSALFTIGNATLALAQEHAAEAKQPGLVDFNLPLMFYTLLIFLVTLGLLWKLAFPKILGAVEAREKALEDAIQAAKADRDAAAKLLAEQTAQLDAARGEAQKFIADARGVAEKMRAEQVELTRKEQADMLERAKRDIESEKDKAIAQLRREAVELAIVGASKVIEENLDNDKNRKLVEGYLSSIGSGKVTS